MDLGENIKKYRKQKGLTQKILASKVGVTASTITKYEKGDLEPSLDTIKKIANVLDVPMSTIIGDNLELGFQAHINGYAKENIYYRSPSDIREEEIIENINNDFDKFASNKYLQEIFNYKYEDMTIYEQDELCQFIINELGLKIDELKYRKNIIENIKKYGK